ncbi:MAG: efflux RND transporter periplasmic adaptor subunit [Gammaproteobacteria bacterium]|nr:efflux RND transporter periplasmic adaptor subunit [Gammaproteobacteria bacterium]
MNRIGLAIGVLVIVAVASGVFLLNGTREAGSAQQKPMTRELATPVIVAPVVKSLLADRIEALGTTHANESIVVTADVMGRVEKVNFRDGMKVQRGADLIVLDYKEEQAQLAAARANLEAQQTKHERLVQLVAQQSAARIELDEQINRLRAAEARLDIAQVHFDDRTIRAPFSGYVGIRDVSPGALVSAGTQIATLDDLSVIKLDFSVPEVYLGALRRGQRIVASSVAYPQRKFRGEVITIDSRVDPVTRAVLVRAELSNDSSLLKPGMLINVNLIANRTEALVVPEESLVPEDDNQYVYVVDNHGQARQIEVEIGRRRPGMVEIVKGLQAGDKVVTEGVANISSNTEVRILAVRRDVDERSDTRPSVLEKASAATLNEVTR